MDVRFQPMTGGYCVSETVPEENGKILPVDRAIANLTSRTTTPTFRLHSQWVQHRGPSFPTLSKAYFTDRAKPSTKIVSSRVSAQWPVVSA